MFPYQIRSDITQGLGVVFLDLGLVSFYLIRRLPGEVHVVDVDWDRRHPLLRLSEVVGEWSHFPLRYYQNIFLKTCQWKLNTHARADTHTHTHTHTHAHAHTETQTHTRARAQKPQNLVSGVILKSPF